MIEMVLGTTGSGALYAVLAALSFALWNIYLQRGLERGASSYQALFGLSLAISISFLPVVALAAGLGALPPLGLKGLAWFALAGLMTGAIGPFHATQATRRIGAARTTAIRLLDPFFAFLIALVFLGEGLRGSALMGITLIVAALGLLQLDARQHRAAEETAGHAAGTGFAVAASLSFTLGSVARKVGLAVVPSALVAGLMEGLAGLTVISLALGLRGRWPEAWSLFRRERLDIWWSGFAAAAGTLFLNPALQRVPVPVAVALRNASPWFALLLVPLIMGRQHRPGRWVWLSTALLTAGMLLIVLR